MSCDFDRDDSISRQAAIDAIMGEHPEAHYPAWYAEKIRVLPNIQKEPLTYAEKILFDAIMRCERGILCEMNDSVGVNLCDEIIRKVKGALWG